VGERLDLTRGPSQDAKPVGLARWPVGENHFVTLACEGVLVEVKALAGTGKAGEAHDVVAGIGIGPVVAEIRGRIGFRSKGRRLQPRDGGKSRHRKRHPEKRIAIKSAAKIQICVHDPRFSSVWAAVIGVSVTGPSRPDSASGHLEASKGL